jgi:hypothetical protein
VSKRRRPAAARRLAEQRFWGKSDGTGDSPDQGEEKGPARIRPTTDPAALIRSLGPAPLALDSAMVERHLTAVYEEAVRAATALAAANGLLASDDEDF